MKFLVDTSPANMAKFVSSDLFAGQLLTPLTCYANWGGVFAIDNGAFSRFHEQEFASLLSRSVDKAQDCLFVACPDIVGSHRRTREIWMRRHIWFDRHPAFRRKLAFVAQDGAENGDIPWDDMGAVFIGGRDPWKDGQAVADIVKTAKTLGIHTHIGRVNTPKRFLHFHRLGADTCDGSGIAMYDHMLKAIEAAMTAPEQPDLFAEDAK